MTNHHISEGVSQPFGGTRESGRSASAQERAPTADLAAPTPGGLDSFEGPATKDRTGSRFSGRSGQTVSGSGALTRQARLAA